MPPGPLPFTCGTETKNFCVVGSHTDCSRPLVALGVPLVPSNGILATIELLMVLKTVRNGVAAALLAVTSRLIEGATAISSTRFWSGVPVATLVISGVVGGVRLKTFR